MFLRILAFLLVAFVVSGVGTIAEILIKKIYYRNRVVCPKCHRPMDRRPAWYHCAHCDCYVVFDFIAFSKHWTIKELRDDSN